MRSHMYTPTLRSVRVVFDPVISLNPSARRTNSLSYIYYARVFRLVTRHKDVGCEHPESAHEAGRHPDRSRLLLHLFMKGFIQLDGTNQDSCYFFQQHSR